MALKDKLMTLEDFKAVRDVDVASNTAQFTEIKADLGDLSSSTSNINTSPIRRVNVNSSTGVISAVTGTSHVGTAEAIQCSPSTQYTITLFDTGQSSVHVYTYFYTSDGTYISGAGVTKYNVATSTTITTPATAGRMAVILYKTDVSESSKIMVSEGSTAATAYVPPTTAKDIVARNQGLEVIKIADIANGRTGSYLRDCFEIGNIVMSNNGFTYGTGSSPTRVRTKEGLLLRMYAGDVFGLSDYTDAMYYIGWRKDDGTYDYRGWLSEDFTLVDDGWYAILIRNRTERNQSSSDALAGLCFGYSFTRYYEQEKFVNLDLTVKAINHRGYNKIAPENTLPAYQLSKKMGFNIVETDVCLTSDGVPVLLHDSTINRTARNADGTTISSTINIADITYAQALTYDFGIWKSSAYAGTKIPTLEQFLVLCRNLSLEAYVEIKTDTTYTKEQIASIMDVAKRTGMYDHVTWISFLPTYLRYVSEIDPNAKIIYVVSTVSNEVITNALSLKSGGNLLAIDAMTWTNEEVQRCITANIPLEVWTVDNAATLAALPSYVSGVTSNILVASKVLYDANVYRTDLY